MSLIPLRWVISAFLLATAFLFQPVQAAPRHHVLILHSYHQGMDWTDGETAGLRESLAKSALPIEFHIEYMDAKRLVDTTHFENLRRLFRHKYKAAKIDAIVVTDNDAFDFMRRYRDELFPDVPVVFCGVNQFSNEQIKGLSGFTGVAETVDSAATLELMLRLHPNTKRIVMVVDNTTTGKALRSELAPVIDTLRDRVDFEWWDTLTPQELSQKLPTLSPDQLVLLMPYASDRNGIFISYIEIARLVTKNSPVPVYANWDFYLGHGIVGGSLTTARDNGSAAGEMLQKILDGEKADNIPVRHRIPGAFMFDYRQLARFNIPRSQLPEFSTIVFQPWHETNQLLLWSSALVALTLAGLFWALLVNIARKRQADAALRENVVILQSHDNALEEISQGVLISGTDRRLTYANHAVERITGYSKNELLGVTCDLLQGAQTDEMVKHQIRQALKQAQPFHGEILNYRKDGSPFWNELSISPVFDAEGKLSQFVGIQSDITARKQTEVDLRIAAKAFESQVAMLVADANGIILRVNQAFTDATGFTAEEAIGRKTSLLKSGRHDLAFYESLWSTLKERHYWQGVIWNRRKDGGIYAEWLTINAVLTANGEITHYVSAFSDITQNKEAEAEVHRLAYYDHLTQLPNRRLLHDRLEQALALAERNKRYSAVLFLDLDNFNTLNDTRGHNTGDLLLIQTAERLRQTLGPADTIARLGGDEFVILLEELSDEAESAAAIAQHTTALVGEAIAQPYNLNGFDCVSTASIGICLFKGEESVELLLKNAEIAMYQAKASGRKGWRFFDPAMQAVLDKRSALENDLRQAIKRHELQLYYQPQVELSGRVVGAEALLRWKHADLGFISPAEFIPLAEETGLILPIGLWVLESACRQIKAWSNDDAARALRISVNISPLQFRQEDFVEHLRTLLVDSAIEASRLRLELTENLILDDVEKTIAKMHAVKAMGVSFSIDDFGTGYSSLAYLTNLPIDELKIDQSFVSNVPGNRNDEIIVHSIITLGDSLNLSVIAEGVETEAQRDFLAQQGCHALQGYLYGRPVPPEEFISRIL